ERFETLRHVVVTGSVVSERSRTDGRVRRSSVIDKRRPTDTGVGVGALVGVTGVLADRNVAKAGRVVPERAYADSCILGPGGADNHRAFTHSRVSIASGVTCERSIAKRIVEWPSGVAHQGSFTVGIVVVPGGVVPERLTSGGRVVAAGIVNKRLKTD